MEMAEKKKHTVVILSVILAASVIFNAVLGYMLYTASQSTQPVVTPAAKA